MVKFSIKNHFKKLFIIILLYYYFIWLLASKVLNTALIIPPSQCYQNILEEPWRKTSDATGMLFCGIKLFEIGHSTCFHKMFTSYHEDFLETIPYIPFLEWNKKVNPL